ncbi:hypothetical protein J7E93_17440 [Streptomyces sp. ISL-36]|uniref:DUF6397 family protein n=1 Tax=Streptomyces sp. ISL-36 TaxID=2819182 RepID=UPI001BEBDECD|nr:DUF6397 family protein [Streptomyces sp. ISL-36]MBT2441863.1 hypothetical protein [Streptomyces sp. ISL-36]
MAVEEGAGTLAPTRAAQELELRRDEFQLAVQWGLIRTVPAGAPDARGGAPGGGRRRVERAEVDRLRAAPDFPMGLRERVRTVGTTEAAALLSVTPDRFTKLARTGHFSPVRFYLNRYRAVVWLYLAGELGEFALTHQSLLSGRLPQEVRDRIEAGEDRRARNWRARRLGLLLRATEDPWARAAAIASLLDPLQLAEVVDDPYERTHLDRLRPQPPSGLPASATGREIADRLMLADDPDEVLWHRMSLALALDEARQERRAPRPDGGAGGRQEPRPAATRPPRPPAFSRPPVRRARPGLLDRLRRRRRTGANAGTDPVPGAGAGAGVAMPEGEVVPRPVASME